MLGAHDLTECPSGCPPRTSGLLVCPQLTPRVSARSAWLARPLPQPLMDHAAAEAEALSSLGRRLREELGREGALQALATATAELSVWML